MSTLHYYKFTRNISGTLHISILRAQTPLDEFKYSCEAKYSSTSDTNDISLTAIEPLVLDPFSNTMWKIGKKYIQAYDGTINIKNSEYGTLTGTYLQILGQYTIIDIADTSQVLRLCGNVNEALAKQKQLESMVNEAKNKLNHLITQYENACEEVELAKYTLKMLSKI